MTWSGLLWWRPPFVLRVCIINLKSDPDTAIRGLLWGSRGQWLTLRDVAILKPNNAPAALPGDFVIHRSNVAFVQVLP